MPYIKKEDRAVIDEFGDYTKLNGFNVFLKKLDRLRKEGSDDHKNMVRHPGTLNYIITRLCDYWTKDIDGKANYERYNAVIGVLECAKQELYRRQIAPYEDEKCEENGDVYRNGTTK